MQHSPASEWPSLDLAMAGRPDNPLVEWIPAGARRFSRGVIAGLLCSWNLVWLALWIGAIGAILGAILGLVAAARGVVVLGPAAGGVNVLVGVVGGFALGFVLIFGFSVGAAVGHLVTATLTGIIIATVLALGGAYFEPWLLRLRGYRRMSRREAERLTPILTATLQSLKYTGSPKVLIFDDAVPLAWAYSRHIVLSAGMLEMEEDELAGILAHELHHWHSGTSVGLRFAWACSLPLALMYDFGSWLAGTSPEGGKTPAGLPGMSEHYKTLQAKTMATVVGWFFLWPSLVLIRYVISPLMGVDSRRDEFEADCAAANAGHAVGLSKALETLTTFERGRSGWETAVCSTHPPCELRLEHLEQHLSTEV